MARRPGDRALIIGRANANDLNGIVAIEQISFPTPWSREALADELERPWSIFRVLRTPGGEVVAYLNYWVVYDEIHVLNVATHPKYRRHGCARVLLEEMVGLARQNASREIHLEVRPSNTAARGLYAALGFVQVGTRPGYYADTGEDALLLRLELTGSDDEAEGGEGSEAEGGESDGAEKDGAT